jgi:hypothetical protein
MSPSFVGFRSAVTGEFPNLNNTFRLPPEEVFRAAVSPPHRSLFVLSNSQRKARLDHL